MPKIRVAVLAVATVLAASTVLAGNFVPVQSGVTGSGGNTTICGQTITAKHTNFYPPSQTPDPGYTGWEGYVCDLTAGTVIPNANYVLQWIVNGINWGCGTPVAGSSTNVYFPATAGLSYKIAAHWKPGHVPPANHVIEICGDWIP